MSRILYVEIGVLGMGIGVLIQMMDSTLATPLIISLICAIFVWDAFTQYYSSGTAQGDS